MDEVNPELVRTFEKLRGAHQQAEGPGGRGRPWTWSSTASASRPPAEEKLSELGIIFCSSARPCGGARSW